MWMFFVLTFLVQILKFKIPHVNTYAVIFICTQYPYFLLQFVRNIARKAPAYWP